MSTLLRPGASLARRPLHFIMLVDCSGSMAASGKIVALNTAVRELLPHLGEIAARNPHAELLMRVVRFASGAVWHLAEPTDPDRVDWVDLQAGGYTDLGAAIDLVGEALTVPPMEERAAPPALVLVSDGMPTDDYTGALGRLLQLPWGQRSVRMAVAIGRDADRRTLAEFIGDPRVPPVSASNPEQLVRGLRWAGTQVAAAASSIAPMPVTPDDLVVAATEDGSGVIW